MEKCRPLDKGSWYRYDAQEVEERLKYCLAVMHSFGLIHKDVKLQNILINGANIPVLADFGISTAVFERPGEKSFTYQEGTFFYMSPEMYSLGRAFCGQVDLFYNDVYGLRSTVEILRGWPKLKNTWERSDGFVANSRFQANRVEVSIRILSDILNKKDTYVTLPDEATKDLFGSYFSDLNGTVVNRTIR